MDTFISLLITIGFIFAIIGVAFLILLIIKKSTYYPPNKQEQASDKKARLTYTSLTLITISTFCFTGAKAIIKKDFKNTLEENKIMLVEFDDVFFSQDDMNGVFNKFESTEGRFRCESFTGFINFENKKSIPIEIIRHCYEKNRYIIISKKYNIDVTIGDIRTSKFDYIQLDTINSQ
jgi:hypothetical protein